MAAEISAGAKFRNSGQVGISPRRFYVHHEIAEKYIEASRAAIARLVPGDGLEPGVTTGPFIRAGARERVAGFPA